MFVNIWIPSFFLRQNHHIYQISIRIKNEEWKVFKRYQQFYDFHCSLKKEYPIVESFELPPKKTVGNKDAKFIEERKRGLQIYLQKTTNYLVRQHSRIRSQLSKDVLINFLPFFSPVHNAFTVNRWVADLCSHIINYLFMHSSNLTTQLSSFRSEVSIA